MEQIDYQRSNPAVVDDECDVNQSENTDQEPPRIVILWDLLKVSYRLRFRIDSILNGGVAKRFQKHTINIELLINIETTATLRTDRNVTSYRSGAH